MGPGGAAIRRGWPGFVRIANSSSLFVVPVATRRPRFSKTAALIGSMDRKKSSPRCSRAAWTMFARMIWETRSLRAAVVSEGIDDLRKFFEIGLVGDAEGLGDG